MNQVQFKLPVALVPQVKEILYRFDAANVYAQINPRSYEPLHVETMVYVDTEMTSCDVDHILFNAGITVATTEVPIDGENLNS